MAVRSAGINTTTRTSHYASLTMSGTGYILNDRLNGSRPHGRCIAPIGVAAAVFGNPRQGARKRQNVSAAQNRSTAENAEGAHGFPHAGARTDVCDVGVLSPESAAR